MPQRPLCAVVLAAGAGTRMKSVRPKPLHQLCGRPMVVHVLDSLSKVHVDWVSMVVGHGAERVVKTLNDSTSELALHYVEQAEQRGTGDAVSIALASLPEELSDEAEESDVLILPGDTPLLEPDTIAALVDQHLATGAAATMLTTTLDEPTGYGRILRDKNNRVRRIVEEADASDDERVIQEVNTSIYVFRTGLLGPALRMVTDGNAQGEYYLTDVIEVLADSGHRVDAMVADDSAQASGVNDRAQLAEAEAELRRRINLKWMKAGVTMVDSTHTYVDVGVSLAEDVTLLPGTRLQGTTSIGSGCEIGPDTYLIDCSVGDGAVVERTDAKMATIGARAHVGPFAVLLPGAEVAEGATIDPFATVRGEDEG